MLQNAHLLQGNSDRNSISEVLYAAAWICGEFVEYVLLITKSLEVTKDFWAKLYIWYYLICFRLLSSPMDTLEAMMDHKVMFLPSHIQSIFVQNATKLYARVVELYEAEEKTDDAISASNMLIDKMPMFVQSADLEVQERVCYT